MKNNQCPDIPPIPLNDECGQYENHKITITVTEKMLKKLNKAIFKIKVLDFFDKITFHIFEKYFHNKALSISKNIKL